MSERLTPERIAELRKWTSGLSVGGRVWIRNRWAEKDEMLALLDAAERAERQHELLFGYLAGYLTNLRDAEPGALDPDYVRNHAGELCEAIAALDEPEVSP